MDRFLSFAEKRSDLEFFVGPLGSQVCVRMRACVCMCVLLCARAPASVCVCVCVRVCLERVRVIQDHLGHKMDEMAALFAHRTLPPNVVMNEAYGRIIEEHRRA